MRPLRPSGEVKTAGPHVPRIEIRVLGPLEVRVDDRAVALPGPKDRGLLGVLAVHANRVVPLVDLARELWDGEVPASNVLARQVRSLRHKLQPESTEHRPSTFIETVPRVGYRLRDVPVQPAPHSSTDSRDGP